MAAFWQLPTRRKLRATLKGDRRSRLGAKRERSAITSSFDSHVVARREVRLRMELRQHKSARVSAQ